MYLIIGTVKTYEPNSKLVSNLYSRLDIALVRANARAVVRKCVIQGRIQELGGKGEGGANLEA